MDFSIVVPCYNEEKNIKHLVERFDLLYQKHKFELILVDNGSSDNTSIEIDKEKNNKEYIKKVTVEHNQGYGYGILSGMKEARGKYIGWIHADLQSDPLVFFDMFKSALLEKNNFIYKGARTNRNTSEYFFTNGMAFFESRLFKLKMEDINSQPTLISKTYFLSWKNPPYDFSLDLYAYALALKKNITVKRFNSPQSKRKFGNSSWNTKWNSRIKMIKQVINYSKETKNRIEKYEEN